MVNKPPFGASIDQVTDYLLELVRTGHWKPGERGPILDDLNEDFFGEKAGPRPGRNAYAPLVEAGMIETRKGSHGGHFLRPAAPSTAVDFSPEVSAVEDAVKALSAATAALLDRRLYVVELQDLRVPTPLASDRPPAFGRSLHSSRLGAEGFAVEYLVRLGEDEGDAREAAALAGFTAAEPSVDWGIRIFAVDLNGKVVDTSRRAAIAGTTAAG